MGEGNQVSRIPVTMIWKLFGPKSMGQQSEASVTKVSPLLAKIPTGSSGSRFAKACLG